MDWSVLAFATTTTYGRGWFVEGREPDGSDVVLLVFAFAFLAWILLSLSSRRR